MVATGIGVLCAAEVNAGWTSDSFGGSNIMGADRGNEEDEGGYEGGPRGAILVYTTEYQRAKEK